MDAYCPRAVRCAPNLLPVLGIHTEAGAVTRVSFRLRRRYAGSRDSWRPLMYCQWRIVPPSLVTV